jgi:DNA-binding NtrC family response regulator
LERYRREVKRELAGFTPGALERLRRYAWPGNVRELENAIERAVVLADGVEIAERDLPVEVREASGPAAGRDEARSFHAQLEEYKRGLILSTLRRTGGNRTHAARLLGLQRTYRRSWCASSGWRPPLRVEWRREAGRRFSSAPASGEGGRLRCWRPRSI